MRKDGIPYVPNGAYNHPFPAVPLQDMTLEEIKKKYLTMCAKSNGDPAVCSKCKTPCEKGKRAVQLVANQVYNDPPVPLYGGKTLIERAKEENMKRRKEKEAAELKAIEEKVAIKSDKPEKRAYMKGDDWWDESLKHGDQIDYLVNVLGFTKTKAKKAIYYQKTKRGMLEQKEEKKENKEIEKKEEPITKQTHTNDVLLSTMELKMDELMKLQTEYKANIEKYTKLYNEVKEKIDTLCKAIDIFN